TCYGILRNWNVSSQTSAWSVREAVNQIVHTELVGLVRLIERAQPAARPLPELRDVGVVVDDGHQALGSIVVFEDAFEDRFAGHVCLRKVSRILDLEEGVEHRIARFHVKELHPRQHALHDRGERFPSATRPAPAEWLEVVDEQESTFLQISAKPFD